MNRCVSLLGVLWVTRSACWALRVHYSSQTIQQTYQGPAIKAIRPNRFFSPAITLK